jgi:hypothetical protein
MLAGQASLLQLEKPRVANNPWDWLYLTLWSVGFDPMNSMPAVDFLRTHSFDECFGSGASAVSLFGLGSIISDTEFRQGKLKPGSILQFWTADAKTALSWVLAHLKANSNSKINFGLNELANYPPEVKSLFTDNIYTGHSMVFMGYAYDEVTGEPIGARVADQGFLDKNPNAFPVLDLNSTSWPLSPKTGYFVGANLD